MTFEEFQATRKYVPDARKSDLPDFQDFIEQYKHPVPVLTYLDDLFINVHSRDWVNCDDQYLLVIENQEWSGDDLEPLERTLYEWAQSAGRA